MAPRSTTASQSSATRCGATGPIHIRARASARMRTHVRACAWRRPRVLACARAHVHARVRSRARLVADLAHALVVDGAR
eukprot:4340429-Pleurochrysis_carterae.AAC.1